MSVVSSKAGLCAAAVMVLAGAAQAEVLLLIDLSVENQITISSSGGASSADISGGDVTGIYMENFFGGAGSSLSSTYLSGDISTVGDASDGSPALFRASAADPGLNLYSWATASTVSFTSGEAAFEGSATWSLSATSYAEMLAGSVSGDIYFPADDAADLSTAVVIGQYRVVPAPGVVSLAALGLGLGATRRRR